MNYPALIDGEAGAYGVAFPDLPGIVAMGDTLAEAVCHAETALEDYAIEAERDGMALMPPKRFGIHQSSRRLHPDLDSPGPPQIAAHPIGSVHPSI